MQGGDANGGSKATASLHTFAAFITDTKVLPHSSTLSVADTLRSTVAGSPMLSRALRLPPNRIRTDQRDHLHSRLSDACRITSELRHEALDLVELRQRGHEYDSRHLRSRYGEAQRIFDILWQQERTPFSPLVGNDGFFVESNYQRARPGLDPAREQDLARTPNVYIHDDIIQHSADSQAARPLSPNPLVCPEDTGKAPDAEVEQWLSLKKERESLTSEYEIKALKGGEVRESAFLQPQQGQTSDPASHKAKSSEHSEWTQLQSIQEAEELVERPGRKEIEEQSEVELRKRLSSFGYTRAQIEATVKQQKEGTETKHTTTTTTTTLSRLTAKSHPVYPKIHSKYLAIDTLRYYELPWEYDVVSMS